MYNVYRTYRGIPTRNSDWLRQDKDFNGLVEFCQRLYEQANGFAIAIYETVMVDGTASSEEILRYRTAGV